MATVISKILVRQGALSDLPILSAGELGYATDRQRLFIGNPAISRTITSVTESVTDTGSEYITTVNHGIDLDNLYSLESNKGYRFYLYKEADADKENPYDITDFCSTDPNTKLTTITIPISDPSSIEVDVDDIVDLYYNTEITTTNYNPREIELDVFNTVLDYSSAQLDAIQIDITRFDSVCVKYSMLDQNGNFRKGYIDIMFNPSATATDKFVISDTYNTNDTTSGNFDIVFSGSIDGDLFKLNYSNVSSTQPVELTWSTESYKAVEYTV
jgi:hypothetical protein